MSANKKLLLLPGDGIGPEIVSEVYKIIDWMDKRRSVTFDIKEGLIGGVAIDATGGPLPDKTLEASRAAGGLSKSISCASCIASKEREWVSTQV